RPARPHSHPAEAAAPRRRAPGAAARAARDGQGPARDRVARLLLVRDDRAFDRGTGGALLMMRTLALFLCVVAAGCGFEREAPYAGARVPDVAPWSDLGPVDLCLAAARIVAPSLCGTAAAAGASCASDGDCKSRERCVCGACTVAVCDSADECGPADGGF